MAPDTEYSVHVVAYNSEGSSLAAIMPVATGNQTYPMFIQNKYSSELIFAIFASLGSLFHPIFTSVTIERNPSSSNKITKFTHKKQKNGNFLLS